MIPLFVRFASMRPKRILSTSSDASKPPGGLGQANGGFASNFANAVLVDLGERRLVVTPDNPEGLLEALGTRLL